MGTATYSSCYKSPFLSSLISVIRLDMAALQVWRHFSWIRFRSCAFCWGLRSLREAEGLSGAAAPTCSSIAILLNSSGLSFWRASASRSSWNLPRESGKEDKDECEYEAVRVYVRLCGNSNKRLSRKVYLV